MLSATTINPERELAVFLNKLRRVAWRQPTKIEPTEEVKVNVQGKSDDQMELYSMGGGDRSS